MSAACSPGRIANQESAGDVLPQADVPFIAAKNSYRQFSKTTDEVFDSNQSLLFLPLARMSHV